MTDPFITPEMEAPPGPHCRDCKSPGEFRTGARCYGCAMAHMDRQHAADRIRDARKELLKAIFGTTLPDETNRHLVAADRALAAAGKILAHEDA
jgi:hypothetical protein